MTRVLAGIDGTEATDASLRVAEALGDALQANVDVVHVRESGDEEDRIRVQAASAGVTLRILGGEPQTTLLEAIAEPDVAIAVLGCRGVAEGRRPAGHIALGVLADTDKPVLVVPPETKACPHRRLCRVLLPLDGTPEAAEAVRDALDLLAATDVEVIVLHVFDAAHVPAFDDQPQHELEAWLHEFGVRHAVGAARVEVRRGSADRNVREVAEAEGVDLVVVGWSQILAPGHAEVIRELLSASPVPVLLLPVGKDGTEKATGTNG